jgi:hypothetical protein
MKKTILILISIILLSVTNQSYGMDTKIIQLDPGNILTGNDIELTVDNTPVIATVVKQDDMLYIDSSFFTNLFNVSPDAISKNMNITGTLKDPGTSQFIICLPVLQALKIMGLRYTYNPIYGKEILRIRTDREFKVDTTYKPPETSSQGNIPNPQNTLNTTISTITPGYPNIVYTAPAGYGYYYPPGYQPGFYFGNYGFVNQGPSAPSIYNIPLPVINF